MTSTRAENNHHVSRRDPDVLTRNIGHPRGLDADGRLKAFVSLRQLSYVVTSLRYDVGIMLDAGAEKIFVVDEHGVFIDSDRMLTLITKYMAMCHPEMKKVAVPVSASGEIDLVAAEHHVDVVRTPDSHLALMDAACAKTHLFVGGTKGGFIFPEFLFASDAMYSVAKLMECMALSKKKLGELDPASARPR